MVNEKQSIEKVTFNPNFTDQIYFVYLNKKQNSKTAIANYYKKPNDVTQLIPKIDKITSAILNSKECQTFASELEKHEKIMSGILKMETVKKSLFPDFKGTIKSLGAWGGDFILVISKDNPSNYFKEKGYETILSYKEIIL